MNLIKTRSILYAIYGVFVHVSQQCCSLALLLVARLYSTNLFHSMTVLLLCTKCITYLRINPNRSGMFNERLDNTSAAEGTWCHHEHLILLYSLKKSSHVGFDCLWMNDRGED